MFKLLFTIVAFLLSASWVESQTVLQGQIRDNKEPLIGVPLKLSQKGIVIRGGITDTEGKFRIQVDSGTYEVEVNYTGDKLYKAEKVSVLLGELNTLDITLDGGLAEDIVEYNCHFGWWVDLLDKDPTNTGQIFTADQLRHMY